MSHSKLRSDKTCLNCNDEVTKRYCPNCGQENTEPKAPYHYLFTHFIEDFTHYDGQFWYTFKNLFLKPGYLTNIYLIGKRQKYVSPVKLYIFISFLTFFIPPLVGSLIEHRETLSINFENRQGDNEDFSDFLNNELYNFELKKNDMNFLDLIIFKPLTEKYVELSNKGLNKDEIADRIIDSFIHNLPRALFIFLPIFAFIMWIFHNKEKWYYSEHGIFTLHFFSMILIISMFSILEGYFNDSIMKTAIGDVWMFVFDIFDYFAIAYIIIYFLIALKRVYHEKVYLVLFKGLLILLVSSASFLVLLLAMTVYSIKMVH